MKYGKRPRRSHGILRHSSQPLFWLLLCAFKVSRTFALALKSYSSGTKITGHRLHCSADQHIPKIESRLIESLHAHHVKLYSTRFSENIVNIHKTTISPLDFLMANPGYDNNYEIKSLSNGFPAHPLQGYAGPIVSMLRMDGRENSLQQPAIIFKHAFHHPYSHIHSHRYSMGAVSLLSQAVVRSSPSKKDCVFCNTSAW